MTWIEENEITVMTWPANSPDQNPIENIWGIVKQKLQRTGSLSRADLITKVMGIWKNDNELKRVCATLVNSMPQRIADVIKSHGDPIKYSFKSIKLVSFMFLFLFSEK